jgi:hypothetical protein
VDRLVIDVNFNVFLFLNLSIVLIFRHFRVAHLSLVFILIAIHRSGNYIPTTSPDYLI